MIRGRQLLAVGFVVLVALPGTAVAAPSGNSIDDACSAQDQTTLLYVEGNDTAVTDSVTLYPGTQVHIAYCGDTGNSDTGTWTLAADGIDDVSSTSDLYSGTVSGDQGTILLDEDAIEGKIPSNTITITVQQGPVVQSNLTDSALLFRNDTAAAFRNHEAAYLSSASELTATAQRLDETAGTLESGDGDTLATIRAANDTLANMSETRRAAVTDANDLRLLLYGNVTAAEQAPGSYTSAMGAIDDHERETNETVMNATEQYNDALDTVESNARQTILMNLLIGVVPGLLVGGVGGAAVIYRLGESAQFFRDYGGGDYGSKQLYGLVGAGLVLVAVGVASLAVTGFWRAIA
jgi:adhesin HecA-like repeat protein